MNRDDDRLANLAAMMMREVLCEQVYRQRLTWLPNDRICTTLGMRTIAPADIMPSVVAMADLMTDEQIFAITGIEWKLRASNVLDHILAHR